MNVFLFGVVGLTGPLKADDYFTQRLDEIEKSLVAPPDSYSLVITDTCKYFAVGASGQNPPITVRDSLYVSGEKVRHKVEKFGFGEPDDRPRLTVITVSPGADVPATQVTFGKDEESRSLTSNLEDPVYKTGLSDAYLLSSAQNSSQLQPVQILLNPCFAQLGVTPVQIKNLEATELPSESELKVYEVMRKNSNGYQDVFRFTFSTKHQDKLSQSFHGIGKESENGKIVYDTVTTSSVDDWQQLANGDFVPKTFSKETINKGKLQVRLSRSISDPVIGAVDESQFDIKDAAEFQGEMAMVLDASKPAQEQIVFRRPRVIEPSPGLGNKLVWLIALNVLVLLALVVAWWYKSRSSRA